MMTPIALRADLLQTLEDNATQEKRSLSDLVNEAVEHYFLNEERRK